MTETEVRKLRRRTANWIVACATLVLPMAAGAAESQTKPAEPINADWAQLARYRADDVRLEASAPDPEEVVFYGDSITDYWIWRSPAFFVGKP